MKIDEIRAMSNEELTSALNDNRQEYMNIRFQVTTGQQTDTSRLSAMRQTIAQMETILRERQLNLNLNLTEQAKKSKPKASKRPTKEEKTEKKEKVAVEGVAIPSEEEQRKEMAREEAKNKKVAEKEPKGGRFTESTNNTNKQKNIKGKKAKEGDK
jgi:large subunit ribosomal protein L29